MKIYIQQYFDLCLVKAKENFFFLLLFISIFDRVFRLRKRYLFIKIGKLCYAYERETKFMLKKLGYK